MLVDAGDPTDLLAGHSVQLLHVDFSFEADLMLENKPACLLIPF